MKNNIIKLEDYRVKGSKVFTGRDRGRDVRLQSNIDAIEQGNTSVEVIIPENTYSINPSFLEELLVNVVTKLGKEGFMAKFKFTSEGDYQYESRLEEAIDRILRSKIGIE